MNPPDFDPVARPYRFLEYASFGPALWRRRIAFLSRLAPARRVLMLGEGDGRFLQAFLQSNPDAAIDYLDASPAMTALARSRARSPRVRFHTANALTSSYAPAGYDLLVTHFFLDCFGPTELPGLIESLAAAAQPRAQWLISDFRAPNLPARLLVRGLYFFFAQTTGLRTTRLTPHAPLLEKAGFQLRREETALGGLLASELWQRS